MRIQVVGKRWNLKFVPRLTSVYGNCQSPNTRGKQIRVLAALRGQKRLEIIVHELLHAASWQLDEEFVSEAACDIAKVLWDLGYRCDKDV